MDCTQLHLALLQHGIIRLGIWTEHLVPQMRAVRLKGAITCADVPKRSSSSSSVLNRLEVCAAVGLVSFFGTTGSGSALGFCQQPGQTAEVKSITHKRCSEGQLWYIASIIVTRSGTPCSSTRVGADTQR